MPTVTRKLRSVRPEIEILEDVISKVMPMIAKANPDMTPSMSVEYTVTTESKGQSRRLASFAPDVWADKKEKSVCQITFSEEHLLLPSVDIIAIGVHEGVHMFNHQCGVQDCNAGGRHSKKFKTPAEKSGLKCEPPTTQNVGYGYTSASDELIEWIKATFDLAKMDKAFDKARKEKLKLPKKPPKVKRNTYDCGCTKAMVATELGTPLNPVMCTLCGEPFIKIIAKDGGTLDDEITEDNQDESTDDEKDIEEALDLIDSIQLVAVGGVHHK
tara:strand:+ start:139 stop:951 length:813 start_codon:yes stop_codon:yes gene_type:complete